MSRPNFLFIYIDDLRYMLDADADPHADHLMPRIKEAQREGISFENVQCPKAICTPSRVSLLTGRHVRQTTSRVYRDSFKDKLETFPGVLHSAGYETYAFGKVFDSRSFGKNYNNIDLCGTTNTQRGNFCSFDDSFSGMRACCISALGEGEKKYGYGYAGKLYEGQCRYIDREGERVVYTEKSIPAKYHRCRNRPNKVQGSMNEKLLLYKGGDVLDHTDYGIANAAIEKVKELASANKTFFVAVGFNKPHLSLAAPHSFYDALDDLTFEDTPYWTDTFQEVLPGPLRPDFAERDSYRSALGEEDDSEEGVRYTSIKRQDFDLIRRAYYATVNYIDELTGIVLKELKNHNKQTRDNTHVIITSDHGFLLGEYGRIAKWTVVEATARVPLIFIPAKSVVNKMGYKVGTVVSSPVHQVDIFPTVLELADLKERYVPSSRMPKDKLPGSSLVPYFVDTNYFNRAVSVSEYDSWSTSGQVFSLRSKYFRYTRVKNSKKRYLYDYRGGGFYRMIERADVANNQSYREVRKWFDSLWENSRNDFESWNFVLDLAPIDMNFSTTRGVNMVVAQQDTQQPAPSPSQNSEPTVSPEVLDETTDTPSNTPTAVPSHSPSAAPTSSPAATPLGITVNTTVPSTESPSFVPSVLLEGTEAPALNPTDTPPGTSRSSPFQGNTDEDVTAMAASITIAVLLGVVVAVFAYLKYKKKSKG